MKRLIKRIACLLCVAVMSTGVTACGFDVSSSFGAPIGNDESPVDYNAEYLAEKFELESEVAEVIADKLDDRGFGKIKSNKKKIVNGTGSMTFSDGKKKYVINVEDGYITTVTDSDGMVVLTIDDILEIANGPQTDSIMDDILSEPEEPEEPEEPDTTDDIVTSNTGDETSDKFSYISDEAQKVLDSLDTDYSKVNWGVQYSPTGMDGIVISIAPYVDGSSIFLLVAVTNLYDEDVCFSASGIAKGTSGEEVGKVSFFESAIGPGNTAVDSVYCEDVPTGEIYWESIELPNVYEKAAYWESDWAIRTDADGYIEVPFTITSDETMMPGTVTAVILDSNGDILAVQDTYVIDEGKEAPGTIQFFKKEFDGTPVDLAMFTNPLAK